MDRLKQEFKNFSRLKGLQKTCLKTQSSVKDNGFFLFTRDDLYFVLTEFMFIINPL